MNDKLRRIERGLHQPSHGTPIERTPKPTTYYELAQQDAEASVQGRWATERPYTVGSEPTVTGPFAASPIDWTVDGIEPPLGEVVNAFEPVGTPAEVAASLPPDPTEEE
jgi:hypothetical protein